jgi:small conductance mechanosensitive channel
MSVAAIVAGAIVFLVASFMLLRRFERALSGDGRSGWAALLIGILKKLIVLVVIVVALMMVLLKIGVSVGAGWSLEVTVLRTGVRVAIILAAAYVVVKLIHLGIAQMEEMADQEASPAPTERQKRVRTMSGLLRKLTVVILGAIAGMVILRELGVDIMPIITGAGIVGLALGFGAQNLVRDVISGFFLIFEDQVRVGDVAVVNGTAGVVEEINLRTIVLRDIEGTVHIFPNGKIDTLSNRTKEWSGYLIDVGVSYKEDVDYIMAVLRDVGDELKADAEFGPLLFEPMEVMGVDDFGPSQVTIRVRIKTVPLRQADVGRELRRRIKKTFDARGIEMPFPHTSVYFGEASKPFLVQVRREPENQSNQPDQSSTGHGSRITDHEPCRKN